MPTSEFSACHLQTSKSRQRDAHTLWLDFDSFPKSPVLFVPRLQSCPGLCRHSPTICIDRHRHGYTIPTAHSRGVREIPLDHLQRNWNCTAAFLLTAAAKTISSLLALCLRTAPRGRLFFPISGPARETDCVSAERQQAGVTRTSLGWSVFLCILCLVSCMFCCIHVHTVPGSFCTVFGC
ncbi:hypothetical protein BD289DRAFT_240706 [Coniella lustricola]|uniref:Uncharacterized protein n=1 Tax=Coniella lustricola TaxID=2025994 RepID=A0A2T3ALE4_9PEZI|nr:hypothetical protein BD289DRAFT_240706 [Coniella lustricola]